MKSKTNNYAKKANEGAFDAEMSYGWASDANSWERIYSKASQSSQHAKAALLLIADMENAGIAHLPRAGHYMREVARTANKTIRENQVWIALKKSGIRSCKCK